jgi:hypothetical protein
MKTSRRGRVMGGTKKSNSRSKSKSMTKDFKIIGKPRTKETKMLWMQSFNTILKEIETKIKNTDFLNEHSFSQFLKVYKPYIKIKSIVDKLKVSGDSILSIKMYKLKNMIVAKFKEIEQKRKKNIVLDDLKMRKPSKGTRGSPRKGTRGSPRKGTRGSPRKGTRGSPHKGTRGSPRKGTKGSPRTKQSMMKSSISLPEFTLKKYTPNTPETPKTADLAALLNKRD